MNIPEGKYAWMVKIGEKGQFVIPKEAREMFDFQREMRFWFLVTPGEELQFFPKQNNWILSNRFFLR